MGKRIGYFNLVNYKDHPANEMYKVINFNSKEESDFFEEKLIEGGHFYEKDNEPYKDGTIYLFAVKNREFRKIQRLNFEVHSKYRKPMVKNKYGRYALVAFFIFIMTIALIGFFKTPNY